MKKILLICSIVFMGFMLNSCLDSEDQNITGSKQFSYITSDNLGNVYARSTSGYVALPITFKEINMLEQGRCYLLSYTWISEYGMTQLSDGFQVYNVVLTAEPEPVPSAMLHLSDAPQGSGVPFYRFSAPFYSSDEYFGDFWLFSYQWKKKKGEEANVEFYKSSETMDTSGEILIDVRLNKIGTPTETTETITDELIAVNLHPLRNLLQTPGGTKPKEVPIRFRYYIEGKSEPTKSSQPYYMIIYTD